MTTVIQTIHSLTPRGLGVANVEDTQVAVAFTLPGEEAEFEVIHPKRREPWGKLVSLTNPSPDRQEAACPHFGHCGGCVLQHMRPEVYQSFKVNAIKDILRAHGLPTDCPGETFFIGPQQRRRIDISGRMTEDGLILGFHNINSKRPFTTTTCAVLHPDIEALFAPLHQVLSSFMLVREKIHVFFTVASNGVDVMLAGLRRPLSEAATQSLVQFAKDHNLVRLVFKLKKRAVLFERETPVIHLGGFPVEVASNAFLQASKAADEILSKLIVDSVPKGSKRIADLFCGRGTLSLPLIQAGYHVDGYECDDHALAALAAVEAPNLRTFSRNLFEKPLTVEELTPYDVVVLDPPRSGIKEQVQTLGDAGIQRLIYVSCGPLSFARDGALLKERGYALTQLNLIDQFIWTPHMELVGVFQKRG